VSARHAPDAAEGFDPSGFGHEQLERRSETPAFLNDTLINGNDSSSALHW
jgi:hypothetical protein